MGGTNAVDAVAGTGSGSAALLSASGSSPPSSESSSGSSSSKPSSSSSAANGERLTTTIDGETYVVTEEFLASHPGGRDLLLLAASRDSSLLVASYHRRDASFRAALAQLPRLSGAEAASERAAHLAFDKQSAAVADVETASPLYAELKRRVNNYFTVNGISSSRGGLFMAAKSLLLIAAAVGAWYASHVLGFFALSPLTGFLLAMLGLCVQHDANHGSLTSSPTLNRAFGFCNDIIGGSALCWRTQHNAGHHQHVNDELWDADSYGTAPIFRMNPASPRLWFHAYQAYYAPAVYALLGLFYPIRDLIDVAHAAHMHVPLQPRISGADWALFALGKVIHYAALLVTPVVLHGASAGVFLAFLPAVMTGGCFLALSFAASHNVDTTAYNLLSGGGGQQGVPAPPAGAKGAAPSHCFAEMQIMSSADWAPSSFFSCLLWGGLNTQIAHHLFPGVAHVHYPAISAIVADVCKQRGVRYNGYATFYEILCAHLHFLHVLGNSDGGDKHMGTGVAAPVQQIQVNEGGYKSQGKEASSPSGTTKVVGAAAGGGGNKKKNM